VIFIFNQILIEHFSTDLNCFFHQTLDEKLFLLFFFRHETCWLLEICLTFYNQTLNENFSANFDSFFFIRSRLKIFQRDHDLG